MHNSKFEYIKDFETKERLLDNTYIVVRIDGKGFTKFTDNHHFKKPNDIKGIKLMMLAGLAVVKSFNDIFIAYGQSDEFSFGFKKSTIVYNRLRDKMLISKFYHNHNIDVVSLFTSAYVFNWKKIFKDQQPLLTPPCFDARIVLYPSLENLKDYFSWRMADCHINNLYNTTFWALVSSGLSKDAVNTKLKGTFSKDKNDILNQFGINYTNEPEVYKRGTVMIRLTNPSLKGKYQTDKVLYEEDEYTLKLIKENQLIEVCHEDIIKDEFWNKEIINFN